MPHFRVTKYNPEHRDASGAYLRDEWTSFSDIGKVFSGTPLTLKTYEDTENAYVNTALAFLQESGTSYLHVVGIEVQSGAVKAPHEGEVLNLEGVASVIRGLLRESFWCRLEGKNVFIHVGWDYYMYVGIPNECPVAEQFAISQGLFVETSASPYAPSAA